MTDDPAVRIDALESLLVEKGLVDSELVDDVIEHYETHVGPLNGAKVVARAWTDPAYRERLLDDGTAAVAEMGFGGPEGHMIVALANTPDVHNVVVCTLCSCYPWPVLGLPPRWYKSPEYRSRMVAQPRTVLAEMGLELRNDVRVRVWDSSAEALHAAHVVDAVHNLAIPIMPSRVTRAASAASSRSSEPSGRRGTTR